MNENKQIDLELTENSRYRMKLQAIIQNLEQSLVIVRDNKVDFLNNHFYNLFNTQINTLNH